MIRYFFGCLFLVILFVFSSCSTEPIKPSDERVLSADLCSEDTFCQKQDPKSLCLDGGCQCKEPMLACPLGCSWSSGQSSCGCIDRKRDPKHCGSCGNTCESGTCCDGRCCAADTVCCGSACCLVGQTCCNGQCADTKKDIRHCGTCGTSCKTGEVCCGGKCVNIQTDLQHCGACGQVCPTSSCCQGQCCPGGRLCCGDTCVDTKYTTKHCGACGQSCANGEICCDGKCLNPNLEQHCGACGNRCSGLVPSQTKIQLLRAGTVSPLKFQFDKLPKALSTDEVTVRVEIFGDFGNAERYADVIIAGIPQQRIQGGEPTCNWARTPRHTGRYRIDSSRLLGGRLAVEVHLSSKVEVDACVSLQSRVIVSLSYGGRVCCNQRCVQKKRDPQHCGACGAACAKDTVCCGGRCCEAGESCSEGECSRVVAGVGYWVHHLAFHPTQPLLAAATSDGLELWNRNTQTRLYQVYKKSGVNTWGVAFHPKGHFLATASTDGVVQLWDTATGKSRKILFRYPKTAGFVAFSPDGTRLVSSSLDGRMHMWDVASEKQLWTYTFGGTGIRTLVFEPKGKFLLVQASNAYVLVMDLNGKLLKAINMGRFSSSNIESLAIHPNGRWMAVGMRSREIHRIVDPTIFTCC